MAQSPSSTSKSSNVGAIAGGVVGGVVGLAAIAGLAAWFFVKRRRATTPASAAFSDIGGGPGYTQSVYSTNPHPFPIPTQMAQQPRLYVCSLGVLWCAYLFFFWRRIPPTRALSRFPLPPLPSKLHHLTIFTKTHRYPLMSIPSSRVLGSTAVFRRYECDRKMAIGCDFPLINWTTHRISMYVSACSYPLSLWRVLVII